MKCPQCNGERQLYGHTNTGLDSSKHTWGWRPCGLCKGSGSVPDEMAEWIDDGKRLQKARQLRGETMFEMSQRTGISSADISAVEQGRKPSSAVPGYPITKEREPCENK